VLEVGTRTGRVSMVAAETLRTLCEGTMLRGLLRIAILSTAWMTILALLSVVALRWVPPPTTSFMIAERIRAPSQKIEYDWVPWSQISPQAALAVVASEDQRFPRHRGFELGATRRALAHWWHGEKTRGASTITQQVAKNLFLWPGRSAVRKVLEGALTVVIETLWSKQRILEIYLNVAQLGPGTFGVEAASRRYFRKDASKLTASEAALLAVVLPNPERLRVDRPSPYVLRRRAWVLKQMNRLGGTAYLRELDGVERSRQAPRAKRAAERGASGS